MTSITPIVADVDIEEEFRREIIELFYNAFFKPLLEEINKKDYILENANKSYLEEGILKGKIIYKDGYFKGKFNANEISELSKIGAKWDGRVNGYKISSIPSNIIQALNKMKIKSDILKENLLNKLNTINVVESLVKDTNIDLLYKKILDKIDNKLRYSIETVLNIEKQLEDNEKRKLVKEYFNNFKLTIKDWEEEQITSLREMMQENIFAGRRAEYLKDVIKSKYNATEKKATFLAKQETNLLTTKYTSLRYQEAGIEEFIWITSGDSRVREDHKKLNGKTFRYDNPPVINSETGKKGLPGEDFQCRCLMKPKIPK